MKVTPIAHSSGQPGQALGSVDVGRTASPMKLERARAVARGEKVPEQAEDPQANRIQQNVRSIRMRTQRSTNREEPIEEPGEATGAVAGEGAAAVSSIPDNGEQAVVEATQPLSPQFAALAKQKRALQVKEREIQDREKALAANAPTGDADLVARIKSDPLSVLQEHGVTYDQLTEAILAGGSGMNPDIQALKDEIKALKEGVDKTFITKEEQAEEAALTEMLYEAESLAKDGDAFEMIRERNAYDRVLRLIHDTYKKTGRVLDVSEAMNKVEGALLDDAEKLARIKKVQSKLAPPATPPLQQQPPRQMRTLTARDSASTSMSARQRAIAAFNGTLRK